MLKFSYDGQLVGAIATVWYGSTQGFGNDAIEGKYGLY